MKKGIFTGWKIKECILIDSLFHVVFVIIIWLIIALFIIVSNIIAELIPSIDAAAKMGAFKSSLQTLTSVSGTLTQPHLTKWRTASGAGCSRVMIRTHSPFMN